MGDAIGKSTETESTETEHSEIHVGIDVGSTTVKVLAIDAATHEVLFGEYVRHHARQAETTQEVLSRLVAQFPQTPMRAAVCGSGAMGLAEAFSLPFVQEVTANAIAIQDRYPETRTAIELGGQDAKMVFFAVDNYTGKLHATDMRMNGSCAGGTGAFIDEMATLLRIPVEEFDEYASRGVRVYDVSGRCGVYAKTDIQPLLNQGAPKEDLALSCFHAIAKQTIGGLAQGLDIVAPVVFEGGPLTFNPRLIKVFAERLDLGPDDIVVPERPELMIALGAALSLDRLFGEELATLDMDLIAHAVAHRLDHVGEVSARSQVYFADEKERDEFLKRTALELEEPYQPKPGETVRGYLGIDGGSTTTKFALLGEDGRLLDSFYGNNQGEPLDVARAALIAMRERYAAADADLEILGVGTTGYAELLFSEAFQADYHVVETVAHSYAAQQYEPEVSFILDIGGQDMKAIWVADGVITNILVNEACSSGCGSFLENFASTLSIPVEDIARLAFESKSPAQLGSRCTVFMNSSIVTEQKNGKTPADIMAGLCRSIIENVFTKVLRVPGPEALGKHIVVQGGTFKNDAVLAAFEQFIGCEVTRAKHPGLMGAIGVAQLTQRFMEGKSRVGESGKSAPIDPKTNRRPSHFIGLDALDSFAYEQESNLVCPFCANRCNRTCITFANGTRYVMGNRCPKGEVIGDPKDEATRKALKSANEAIASVPNLFDEREELLFRDWEHGQILPDNGVTIGLPRTLFYWEMAPFWKAFWESLGFTVKFSPLSTRKIYEDGLSAVASDTVCFPAKLVHGHIRWLVRAGVDRIFMPTITAAQSENTEETSVSVCAVVKGYPMVIRNSDNPQDRFGVTYDNPLFHWYSNKDRDRQLPEWMESTFGISRRDVLAAIAEADKVQASYEHALRQRGREVLEKVKAEGTYAIVLASRPYQNDALVNHDLPTFFTHLGIPVMTVDSVPGINDVDLSQSLIDITNNFHARMLSGAVLAAQNECLEYVQVVSFGCGHDAYLSDEIIRIMHEISNKSPLVLKLDESDIRGPLRIRVRSFIETVDMKREIGVRPEIHALQDPYPQKFTKDDVGKMTVLVPNTSHAFSCLMSAAFARQGIRCESLPVGYDEAIRLGKKYVHNDICFPCQIVIGEALEALNSGRYDVNKTAVAMGKYIGDCRLTHYTALLRKALDACGYQQVPILTNDDVDYHNVHPGFKMNLYTAMCIAFGLPMIDALEELLRKIRPYELEPGSADAAFDKALAVTTEGLAKNGISGAKKAFKTAIEIMKGVKYDRSNPRPRVLIVGEYLLNFHPGANHDIERYLEANGMEIIEARMTDVIRKSYFYKNAQNLEYKIAKPFKEKALFKIESDIFNLAHDAADKIAAAHPLYEPPTRMQDLTKASDPIIHHTFDAGEGVLIPGEILHHAAHGCRSFVILQPFGCLPNHVVGRGIVKKLKALYPDVQILPLDYDPDVSFANIENRLQMLIMASR